MNSGADETATDLPSGGIRPVGDTFEPNLALGGASYKVPIELPNGPGGMSPKLDLVYNTNLGNGPFGLGWVLSLPYIERKRKTPLRPGTEVSYSVSGAETLIPVGDGSYVPFIQNQLQRFFFDGAQWTTRTPSLIEMRFGATDDSRVTGTAGEGMRTYRWLVDRITFPSGMEVNITYGHDGNQRYVSALAWSVFRLEFVYEARPDPFSQFDAGFELRTARRCVRMELRHARLPGTLMRTYRIGYAQAPHTNASLLTSVQITGRRVRDGVARDDALPPLRLAYTGFSPERTRIAKFAAFAVPPPGFGGSATLLDYRGTSLPGILKLDGDTATYWENRGDFAWGPPEVLPSVPSGVSLDDPGVRFADLTGTGTADLVVAGNAYYPNDPEQGFLPKRALALAPTFDVADPQSYLLDLDGDRVADLLTFRNRVPIAFLNRDGREWSPPLVLSTENLQGLDPSSDRLRFADMNGDGNVDMVLLQSRRIVYWPYLGGGRWGAQRPMNATPEFDLAGPGTAVLLTDVDDDGCADVIVVEPSRIRLYPNQAGEQFGDPVVLDRTPLLNPSQFVLADMNGSGSAGLVWTSEANPTRPHEYWYLDFLAGAQPHLLRSIDNGCGSVTTIEYSTSTRERIDDLHNDRRWTGYLPFSVGVVKRLTKADTVSGLTYTTEYRYHDGHYDRFAHEYLGFAQVDSLRAATANEAPVAQRMYFHNRGQSARDPAFIAGKGQPHRTELLDEHGALRKVDEATWEARTVPALRPAYLAVQTRKTSTRLEDGTPYEREQVDYELDASGNVTRETRRGEWQDSASVPRVDQLRIETRYAAHAVYGTTDLPCEVAKFGAGNRLLKLERTYYDGPDFVGLDFGRVERGVKTRLSEIMLTQLEANEAYGGTEPLLDTLYRKEVDPTYGTVWVRDTHRARFDAYGNHVEILTPTGCRRTVTYDADHVLPVSFTEDGGTPREFTFDPISQQTARVEDRNGNIFEMQYDGLGAVSAVFRPGALAGRPTETYEYRRDVVPMRRTQRVRINADDAVPGRVKHEYLDGNGAVFQTRTLCGDGRWAVGKQKVVGDHRRLLREQDAYYSATPDFEPAPPAGTLSRSLSYDFAGRVREEQAFSGDATLYEYHRSETRFFDPVVAPRRRANPATPPTRLNRMDAWNRIVGVEEYDEGGRYEQRREYDALGRIQRLIDSMEHVLMRNVYDFADNRIRVEAADCGRSVAVLDAAGNEVQRTDADGRVVYFRREACGRIAEVRSGGPAGAVRETHAYGTGWGQLLAGRLARVQGDFGTAEYSYSPEGDPVAIRRTFAGNPTAYEFHFTYNTQRNVTSATYPDGTVVEYRYDATGMLQSIPGYIDAIAYSPTGMRERIDYHNGLTTTKRYTPGDYLLAELLTQAGPSGPKYQHLVYGMDAIGQVMRIDDNSNVTGKMRNPQTFQYDRRGRLIAATGKRGGSDYRYEYRYDQLGNLVFSGEAFAEDMDYGHQAGDAAHPNRLIKRRAAAAPEYTYDASGNLTRDPALGTLTHDFRGRLAAIDRPDGSRVEYVYDHNDRRVITRRMKSGVTTTRYEVEGIYFVDPGQNTKIVFDDDKRLAIVPGSGDPLLHHLDRLGNVNVVSNLRTGAFVGQDEYTPYGQLSASIVLHPAFTFQGREFTDGTDLVLLGARYYRPYLGRFLTPDLYLTVNQEKIAGFLVAANLYVYAYANPVNYIDPTGQIVFLIVLLIAVAVGAIAGAIGAAMNGAKTWDEWLLWIVGGAIGGALTACGFYGLGVLIGCWFGVSATTFAFWATIVWGAMGIVGALITPALDNTNNAFAWAVSFFFKWVHSPILTTLGLFVVAGLAIAGKKVDFRRGMIFVETGAGADALTLGAIAYTQSGLWQGGQVNDNLAKHESVHSRTNAAIGEFGFYVTYIIGGIWGSFQAQGGAGAGFFGLDNRGCGNPFEKLAHSFFAGLNTPPQPQTSASNC